MIFCDRCGIEVKAKGLCGDCEPAPSSEPQIQRTSTGHIRVASNRGGTMTKPEREHAHAEIRKYAALGIPVVEIAMHLGVSSETVYRHRRQKKVAA